MSDRPVHARIDGAVVLIGFGSVGKGVWALLERHLAFDHDRFVVIEPDVGRHEFLHDQGLRADPEELTPDTMTDILDRHLTPGQGFVINTSVGVSSLDVMRHCQARGVPYIDAGVEPWEGFYLDCDDNAARSNYALRQAVQKEKDTHPGGTTAISACGARPGTVSWFVKDALLMLARDTGYAGPKPQLREEWAAMMRDLGVKGLHVVERDTQIGSHLHARDVFTNTSSVEGLIAQAYQPAELGWGTHEMWFPENAYRHAKGCKAAIWLDRPGAITRVHSWSPTPGAQFGYLLSGHHAISIADYFTLGDADAPDYRPTCHSACHPCDAALLSLHEMFGAGVPQRDTHVLEGGEIRDGCNELGVLLYGHARGALWYGSRLSAAEAKRLSPYQNAAGLQVSSAMLAGIFWALDNPDRGIVEAEEMDHAACLDIQRRYLGPVEGRYTDWTPLSGRLEHFPEDIDDSDPWQFRNILAT